MKKRISKEVVEKVIWMHEVFEHAQPHKMAEALKLGL